MTSSGNSASPPVPTPGHDVRSWCALAGFLAITFFAAGIGSWLTGNPEVGWYTTIAKPAFNPPAWLFAPVWTSLYVAMALAAWLVFKKVEFTGAHALYALQLVLNVLWTALFFQLHTFAGAFIEILVLWGAVLATMLAFSRWSTAAGLLMVPYLGWVTFAAVLNFALWRLNA